MASSSTNWNGRVVAITGGGSGIGAELAKRVLAEGGSVVINGRREDVLAETAKALDPTGDRVAICAGDIAKPSTGQAIATAAVDRFGRLDTLINNAGVFAPAPFAEVTESEYNRFVDIILKGTFFAAQAALPALKESKGSIVNIGSMWAEQAVGATPSSAYSAAKAGVHALTRNLAIELAADGVRVNTVAPAVVETPVYETFIPKAEVAGVLEGFNAFHPIGRNGQPKDVADAVLFLSQAEWITGTILPVDGGVLAGRH